MSVKIKISYETEQELAEVLQLLQPVTKESRISRKQQGRYKRAYVTIEQRANREKM